MRVPRAGERRSGRLRGRGECARGVQVVAGEEDRWGAGNSPVVPPVGISDQGNLLSRRAEQGRSMGNFLKLHSQETQNPQVKENLVVTKVFNYSNH